MRESIKGIAFDLDGTLYPNYRLNIKLIPFILKEWRLLASFGRARRIIRKEQRTSAVSQNDFYKYQAEIIAKILAAPAKPLQEKIDRLIYRGWEPLFKNIKLFKEAAATLAALKEAGCKLGILSDFPLEKKLEYLGISGIWDAIICSESCGAIKPHERPFAELAQAMSLPPENILYVGNSHSYDVAGAYRAGMKTAWIRSVFFPGGGLKKPKPNFTFSNYRQFYNFMLN
jgi:putative hydrolase of the HAD superfamily